MAPPNPRRWTTRLIHLHLSAPPFVPIPHLSRSLTSSVIPGILPWPSARRIPHCPTVVRCFRWDPNRPLSRDLTPSQFALFLSIALLSSLPIIGSLDPAITRYLMLLYSPTFPYRVAYATPRSSLVKLLVCWLNLQPWIWTLIECSSDLLPPCSYDLLITRCLWLLSRLARCPRTFGRADCLQACPLSVFHGRWPNPSGLSS